MTPVRIRQPRPAGVPRTITRADETESLELASRLTAETGMANFGPALLGLQAAAGNAAVAHLVAGPSARPGALALRRRDEEEPPVPDQRDTSTQETQQAGEEPTQGPAQAGEEPTQGSAQSGATPPAAETSQAPAQSGEGPPAAETSQAPAQSGEGPAGSAVGEASGGPAGGTEPAPSGATVPWDETVQRADDEGASGEEVPLGTGAGAGASSTTVGPPTRSTYSVSGSLQDAADTVAGRTEAGSETSTPSMDTVTDNGRILSVKVTVAQAIELPSWADRASGTAAQQAEWDRFSGALSKHEDGHVQKDVKAWTGAHTKIAGKLEDAGNAAFDKISNAADQANADYDTATDHGRNQGTIIDPNV